MNRNDPGFLLDLQLFHRALGDADARAVLADQLEEAGQEAWARMLHPEATQRDLAHALGCSIRRRPGFLMAEEPSGWLGWRSLCWHIREVRRAASLLRSPTFLHASRFHLHDPKGRQATPHVLQLLEQERPDLTVLEVTGRRTDLTWLEPFRELRWLHVRLPVRSPPIELPIQRLVLTIDSKDDLDSLPFLRLPQLQKLGLWSGKVGLERATVMNLLASLPSAVDVELNERWPSFATRILRQRGHVVSPLVDSKAPTLVG